MLGYQLMGAADCITTVISDALRYNIHNTNIETQPNKHKCRPINKHITNKREPNSNSLGLFAWLAQKRKLDLLGYIGKLASPSLKGAS